MKSRLALALLAGSALVAGATLVSAQDTPPPPTSVEPTVAPPPPPPPPPAEPARDVAPPPPPPPPVEQIAPPPPPPPPPPVEQIAPPPPPPPPPAAAAPPPPPPAAQAAPAPRPRPLDKNQASILDERLATVKAGLKLTADQAPLWPPVETVIRDTFAKRAEQRIAYQAERRAERESKTQIDPVARLRERADFMAGRAEDMRSLAAAAEPLYRSLDDGQRRRLAGLLRADDRPPPKAGRRPAPERPDGRPRGNNEERSMFDKLRDDVRRGWRDLWE